MGGTKTPKNYGTNQPRLMSSREEEGGTNQPGLAD